MLRAATWTVRLVAAVVIAYGCLTGNVHGAHLYLAAATLTVSGVGLVLWALIVWTRVGSRSAGRLSWILGTMALFAGFGGAVPGAYGIGFLGVMATLQAGTDETPPVASVVCALGILSSVTGGLVFGDSLWSALGFPALLVVGLLLGLNRRSYRVQAEQNAALLARMEELEEERRRVATLDERSRIAREIHDVLAHSLGALGVQIQVARAVLVEQHDPAKTVELLEKAQRMAADGLAETRRAVRALRVDSPRLEEALRQMTAEHGQTYGAHVSFHLEGNPRPVTPDAGLALTRAAQESLVNAAKHAPHRPVDVDLDYRDGHIRLQVVNSLDSGDASPAVETANTGYGLAGMRERLLLSHGRLDAGRDGGRWVVTAEVPQ